MRYVVCSAVILVAASIAFGLDLNLTDGSNLADIRLRTKTDRGITVAHRGGVAFVDYKQMRSADALTFGFDQSRYDPSTAQTQPSRTDQPPVVIRPARLYTPLPATPAPPAAHVVSTPSPRPASTRTQCAATTKKGYRCTRMAAAGSSYCWQHP